MAAMSDGDAYCTIQGTGRSMSPNRRGPPMRHARDAAGLTQVASAVTVWRQRRLGVIPSRCARRPESAAERCQSGLQQLRGLAYVAADRVAQLNAAPAGADVTNPRVHVDLDQASERPAGDRRLGIGGARPPPPGG